jgi:hypothetical protein
MARWSVSVCPEDFVVRFLLAVVSFLLAVSVAEARPSTLDMSCNQAQELVASRGAVVLSTGRYTFNRFVASHAYCLFGEHAERASAPTRDRRSCPLGYVCKSGSPFWMD